MAIFEGGKVKLFPVYLKELEEVLSSAAMTYLKEHRETTVQVDSDGKYYLDEYAYIGDISDLDNRLVDFYYLEYV